MKILLRMKNFFLYLYIFYLALFDLQIPYCRTLKYSTFHKSARNLTPTKLKRTWRKVYKKRNNKNYYQFVNI